MLVEGAARDAAHCQHVGDGGRLIALLGSERDDRAEEPLALVARDLLGRRAGARIEPSLSQLRRSPMGCRALPTLSRSLKRHSPSLAPSASRSARVYIRMPSHPPRDPLKRGLSSENSTCPRGQNLLCCPPTGSDRGMGRLNGLTGDGTTPWVPRPPVAGSPWTGGTRRERLWASGGRLPGAHPFVPALPCRERCRP